MGKVVNVNYVCDVTGEGVSTARPYIINRNGYTYEGYVSDGGWSQRVKPIADIRESMEPIQEQIAALEAQLKAKRSLIGSMHDELAKTFVANGVVPKATGGQTEEATRKAAIRKWARDNGQDVTDRGRIAQTVVDAYDKAQAPSPVPEVKATPSVSKLKAA